MEEASANFGGEAETRGLSELGIKGWIEFVHKITLDDRNLFKGRIFLREINYVRLIGAK